MICNNFAFSVPGNFDRPGLRGRRYSVGGNAGDPDGRTVGIAGRSSTFRPPDKLVQNKDSAGRGTSSVSVDGPGGSRERRLGGRVYLPRVSDLARWRK